MTHEPQEREDSGVSHLVAAISTTAPAPTRDEQIAAVEECLDIARGVARGVLGSTAGFVALRELYALRIARLEAAVATLKAAQR